MMIQSEWRLRQQQQQMRNAKSINTSNTCECVRVNAVHRVFDYDLRANDSIGIPKPKRNRSETKKEIYKNQNIAHISY